jgi:predicted lipoprotein with Yx(FWY)xxD motif
VVVFVAVEIGMFVAVLVLARHQWFTHDEWSALANRRAGSINDLLRPDNANWATLPILAYRLWFHLFGLRTYLPYQITNVLFHLTAGVLLRVIMRRAGVRPWIATAGASLFVLFGAGYADIIYGIEGFVGSLVFGLIQLLLASHDGPIGRRDWLGLLAGVAGLMCSTAALPMVVVVGLATMVRRGWRVALFHTVPLAAIYVTWWIGFGQRYYHAPSTASHLGLLARWVGRGVTASFDAMGQLPGVGIALAVLLAAGLVLAWSRLDREEVRKRAAAPGALLIGAVLFLLTSGWGRAVLYTPHQEIEGGHYLYISVAMALPAIAVAADAIARRWKFLLPVVLAPLMIGIPGNLQALANPKGLLDPQFQAAYRKSVLSLVSVPTAYAVPRSIQPDRIIKVFQPGEQYGYTIGWLLDQRAAGRLPTLGPNDLHVLQPHTVGPSTRAGVSRLLVNATLQVSLQQSNTYLGSGPGARSLTPERAPSSPGGATPSSSSAPLVSTAQNSKLGTILVDSRGKTLYMHIKSYSPIGCTGRCARAWTPLTLPPTMTTPTGGPGVYGLGKATIGRAVTYLGLYPLYRFSGDKVAGEAKGNDIASAGGLWRVVKVGTPKTCSPLVAPVVHRLQKGDTIFFSGGPVEVTYLAGSIHSDSVTFDPAKGNTLGATAGPLTISMQPAGTGQTVTACM